MNTSIDDAVTLKRVKTAVIYKALPAGLLLPLRHLFYNIATECGDVDTACALLRSLKAHIILGRKFFTEKVRNDSDAADVVLHELLHHIMWHLHMAEIFERQGFSHDVQNQAEDALINAFLHKVGCAGFMEHYYPDEVPYSFFRPNSSQFLIRKGDVVTAPDAEKLKVFSAFYERLYRLEATLEETLKFFKEHFPDPPKRFLLLGGHSNQGGEAGNQNIKPGAGDKQGAGNKPGAGDKPGNGGAEGEIEIDGGGADSAGGEQGQPNPPQRPRRPGARRGSIIGRQEALKALKNLGMKDVPDDEANNFKQVIRSLTSDFSKPGIVRAGIRVTRHMPAKISRHTMWNIEREKYLFRKPEFRLLDVLILVDASGSVLAYLPFVAGLMAKLRQDEFNVGLVCWADIALPAEMSAVSQGIFPPVGGSTNGDCVAEYIKLHKPKQVAIVTDNALNAPLTVGIDVPTHVCLLEGGGADGGFADRTMVPRNKVHRLLLRIR